MPFAMYGNTHSVVLKGKVYMGGGCASDKLQTCTVVVYDTHSEEWSILPKCWPWVSSFSLAVVKNQLTLVGGLDLSTHKVTNKLAAWESDSRKWTSPYPPMHTARYNSAAATYHEWMVVAGGCDDDRHYLDSVEILNSNEKQWYSAAPLPVRCNQMRSAVVRDVWYLVESNIRQVFAVSLPALILLRGTSLKPWHTLPSAPLTHSAPFATRDSLFAVGGKTNTSECSSAIHLYLPWKKKWIEIAKLPTEWSLCTCTELPNGKILVAGGREPLGGYAVLSNRVDIATVMDSE